MVPGQRYTYINITILIPSTPQSDRNFDVVLLNPKGGAGIAVGSTITVTIRSSRLASGIFQFSNSSLFVTVEKLSGAVAEFSVSTSGLSFFAFICIINVWSFNAVELWM